MRGWGTLANAWRDLTHVERMLFGILWPSGAALFFAGLAGDANGWWEDNAFLLELTGSVTSFLIGLPPAIAVLGRIERSAAEQALDIRTARRAHADAQRFLAAIVDSYCGRALHEEEKAKLREGTLDQHRLDQLGDLHMFTLPMSGAISQAHDQLTGAGSVHEVMASLEIELSGDVAPPRSDLFELGERFFKQAVPSLIDLGEHSLSWQHSALYDRWKEVLNEGRMAAYEIGSLEWESDRFTDAREHLDQTGRLYHELNRVLAFIDLTLSVAAQRMRPVPQRQSKPS